MIPRCSRCLLPADYPAIVFDAQGVCDHCRGYIKREPLGEERLIEKMACRRGPDYDCVVGISGGKDSCYVAYLARQKFGLRVLAVCYDFPFMVDLARENVKAVCAALGIDLLVVRSHNNFEYHLLRNHLISLAATGTTWGQCLFCHYGIESILREAACSREIPYILSGVTASEVWWDPGSRFGYLVRHLKRLPLADQAVFALYQGRACLGLLDQRRQFPIPGNPRWKVVQRARPPAGGPETIRLFDYVAWDQAAIEQTLQAEAGWRKPEQALTWRYDCILEPLLDLTFKRDLGISSAGLYLCGLIRSGGIGREKALRLLEESEDPVRLETSLKAVLDFLDLPAWVQEKFFCAVRS